MADMSVTFLVLKLLKSMDVSDWQPMNMPIIIVTLAVLKLLRSIESKE